MNAIRPTLKDNNFKVCEASLTFLCTFLEHIDAKIFQPYFIDFVNLLLERFGDTKVSVRDKAFEAIIMVARHYSASTVLDSIREGFIHKSWRVREGVCLSFVQILQTFGPKTISLAKFLPDIVSLLDDSTPSVRDSAILGICEIYRFVGADLFQELSNYKLRTSQIKAIEDRACEIMVDTENLVSLKPKAKSPLKPPRSRQTIHTNITTNGKSATDDTEETDVQPIYIKENDIQKETEQSLEILNDTKNLDWKKRLNCIRRWRGIVYGGATDFSSFIGEFLRLREAISKQVVDLRSTIVKESCMLLNLIAKTMGSKFEPLSDYFVPILLKSTVVTVQVISDSVNTCIRTLIIHAKLNRGISVIVERLTDSKTHATMRSRCAEYLVLIFQHVDTGFLSKIIDELCKALKSAINDASPSARQAGRQAFMAFKEVFPDRATKIFSELDPSTQKKLNEESNKSGQISPRSTTSSLSGAASVTSYVSSGSTIRRTKSVITRKLPTKPESSTTLITEKKLISKPVIPSIPLSTTYPPSPKKISLPVRPVSVAGKNSPSSPKKSPNSTNLIKSSRTDSVLIPKKLVFGSDPMDVGEDLAIVQEVETVSTILRESKNLDWKAKITVFEKLESIINSGRSSEIKNTFLQVINLYIDRLSDTYQKVVEKALTSLIKLIDHLPENVEPYLERILSKLFLLLTEEKTKTLAEHLLTKIGNSYSGDILLPRIFKIVDTFNSRVRVACLEFLMHIVQSSSAYLSYPGHMRSSIKKIIALIQQNTSKSCDAALTSIMISLYTINSTNFMEQLLSLPSLEQNPIKNLLRERVSDFDQHLTLYCKLTDFRISKKSSPTTSTTTVLTSKPTLPNRNVENIISLPIRNTDREYQTTDTLDEISSSLTSIAKYKIDKNPHQVYRCLFEISEIARLKPSTDNVWQISFAKLLFYLFDLFFDDDEIIREKALLSVASLLRYQIEHCIKFTDITFRKIMEKLNDNVPAVQRTAERVAEQFVESIEPIKTLELLKPQIINNSEKEQILLGGLRLLTKLIKLISPDILLGHVPSILPGVYEAFKHSNVDVRKSVVYLMVDLHFSLGELFEPYLKRLSIEQQKLIQIYIKKNEVR
ncbi:CLIP-associated protein [Naegleria gruberi]|uniref:CLIP-associated protein n=1 Tax=Naegleria gruberi TaxID=5762 RepID=D2V000_NAEGR|nr:CLIP-associated protein [Naegleria gruberi]EFC50021.1 CLIP-associated protein [Naegleria gruberi]|eukprot:XP_002682765.1 CLIP-associated protein [Naegleria gruberi strain NEG-M]